MECTLYRRNIPVCTLYGEKDGLYWRLFAQLPMEEGILRLYFEESMGVFCPEDGQLVFRKTQSIRELPKLPRFGIVWCEEDAQWHQEKGKSVRYFPNRMDVSVPWDIRTPMELPAPPEQLQMLDGHLVYSLPYSSTIRWTE